MSDSKDTSFDRQFVRNMVESALRIGLIFILLFATLDIIQPFIVPILWGAIIAIAAFPLVKWLEPKLGGRRGLTAGLISFFFILVLVVPTYMVTESLLASVKHIAEQAEQGTLEVPPPPEGVADWPVIGEKVYAGWSEANQNVQAVIEESLPEIKAGLSRMVSAMANGLVGVLMFVISLAIAGGFMAYAEGAGKWAHQFFVRIGGAEPGGEWASLTVATVRSVLQGVVGVAVIQAILCSIGLIAIGIPAASIWSAAILFLAIAQLPALIVVLPTIIWAYGNTGTTAATIFTVWMLAAGLSDNVLKPMLMGRGLDIPMPVILLGAIGGMVAAGIIGLLAGAVVLSI